LIQSGVDAPFQFKDHFLSNSHSPFDCSNTNERFSLLQLINLEASDTAIVEKTRFQFGVTNFNFHRLNYSINSQPLKDVSFYLKNENEDMLDLSAEYDDFHQSSPFDACHS
jgi:hypothetical protein